MLELSVIEFFLRVIPEAFILILGTHIFSKMKMKRENLYKSLIILPFLITGIRSLPISYGVHTLLGIVAVIILTTLVNKLDVAKSIQGVIITSIMQFGVEVLNALWIQVILRKDLEIVFSNPYQKIIYGMPSLIINAVIIAVFYFKYTARKELTENEDRTMGL